MSKEVLFEIWNKPVSESTETFLGLGIVSVDELSLNESQRLIVPLQGMPDNFNDNSAIFGGLLTVHFLITKDERKMIDDTNFITNGNHGLQDEKTDIKNGAKNGIENENCHIDQQVIEQVCFFCQILKKWGCNLKVLASL